LQIPQSRYSTIRFSVAEADKLVFLP
jgi:hypothetical protein